MKNKTVFALMFTIILTVGLTFVFQKLQKNTEVQETKIDISDKLARASINCKIPNVQMYNLEGKKYQLIDLMNSKGKVILNISNCRCNQCIDYILTSLNTFTKKIGSDNILILVDSATDNEFFFFVENYNINLQVFNIKGNPLSLPVDTLHLPYFLLVDSTLRSIDVFVPNESSPQRTDHFLNNTTLNH